MTNINAGTGSGDNSNTSKWGWSGSTLGAASGGARGNNLNPFAPKTNYGNTFKTPGDKGKANTKVGAAVAAAIVLGTTGDDTPPEVVIPSGNYVAPKTSTSTTITTTTTEDTIGAKPIVTTTNSTTSSDKITSSVKIATSNLFLVNENDISVDLMTRIFFEEIGGQELINISRNDLLSGQEVEYEVIKNLASLSIDYNPNNLLRLQGTDSEYFSEFSFNLNKFVPEVGTGQNINEVLTGERVYVESSTGNVIINTINVKSTQDVDIEFLTFEDVIDDTIY